MKTDKNEYHIQSDMKVSKVIIKKRSDIERNKNDKTK